MQLKTLVLDQTQFYDSKETFLKCEIGKLKVDWRFLFKILFMVRIDRRMMTCSFEKVLLMI